MLGFLWGIFALVVLGAIGYGSYYYVHLHGFSGEMLTVILIGWFFILLLGTVACDDDEVSKKDENIFGTIMLVIIVGVIATYLIAHNVDLRLPFTIKRN